MSRSKSLPELGYIVQSRANAIYELFNKANIAQPSLDHGTPSSELVFPRPIREQRAELLEALDELRALVLGPTSYLYYTSIVSPSWLATFNVLYQHRIASHVPNDASISYSDLAARCGLDETDLRRIVRTAISLRVFEEYPVGHVRHNAVSAALAAPLANDAVGFFAQEFTPAALSLPEAFQRFPGSLKANEAAICIANGITDQDIFSGISHDTKRVERFGNAMSFNTGILETSLDDLVEYAPWSSTRNTQLQTPKMLVDVGGSRGKLCEAFLRRFPDIEIAIVEDLPEVTQKNLESTAAEDVAKRIDYQEYNFFTEQVIKNADVYVFRTVIHDWPDSYAIQILKNQIPALKPGAQIIINDICLEPQGALNVWISQGQYAHDIFVKMGLNAKERTREDWEALLANADPRFKLESVVTPPHSILSVIEIIWKG